MENYETIQILGQGSFGTVYLISNKEGKRYALKKVQLNPFKVDEALKQIQVMNKLNHPNLITVFESYYDHDEKLEIMMEFCEEGDLLSYFKKKNKSLSVEQILEIFQQIVKAFVAINIKGVIHRDLKPENVLLTKDKVIKIADFGCARQIEFSKVQNLSLDKGTPVYSSPQHLTNEPYSPKCDVWSAGCLLYFIYYGFHPFLDHTVIKTLNKIKKLTENKQIQLLEHTDPRIAKIIRLTLVYEDKNRATWRQLHLNRFFKPKLNNVEDYLKYIRSLSNIANWITKQFWKYRKTLTIHNNKNQIFAYFMIKFQYTNSLLGMEIIKKSNQYRYMFDDDAYDSFNPTDLNIVKEIQNDLVGCEKYYTSMKKQMTQKKVYAIIQEKQPQRISCFSDLDNSIRAGYKILLEVLPQMKETKQCREMEKVWVMMSKWINFERWFFFQKNPKIQEFMNETFENAAKTVEKSLEKYTHGLIE